MKISVLILTHNRPQLFERCIRSVFAAWRIHPADVEIIVNNDSRDITEIHHGVIPVTYFYEQSNNLSELYRSLFDKAEKEYVYFLEDDDVMLPHFFASLAPYQEDILYFNYVPYKAATHFLRFFDYTKQHPNSTKEEFLAGYDNHDYQFSQICFRKESLPSGAFPVDNNIQNDFVIFKALKGSFRALNLFLYKQTVDGGDNISFTSLNKDPRWNTQ